MEESKMAEKFNTIDSSESIENEDKKLDSPSKLGEAKIENSPEEPDTRKTDNPEEKADPSGDDEVLSNEPAEAADNDGSLKADREILPLYKAGSTANENTTADTDAEADSEVDFKAEEDAESETETEPEDDTEDDRESNTGMTWAFPLTCDSTSLNVITDIIDSDDGNLLDDSEKLDEVEAFISGETKFGSSSEKLKAGQELLREFFALHNTAWSGIVGTFSGYAIQIGRLLLALKALVKECGLTWEPWVAEHVKFMTPRTRQRHMQLAKVRGIDSHLHFGTERLILLDGATKGNDGDDPIGDFLSKYNLGFNPEEEIDLDAYKDAVDLALDFERLKKAGIDVDMESLKKFRADGKTVNVSLIKVLKAVKAANGDPNKHLTDPSSGGSDDGEKKAKSFKKIATTLAGTIDWIDDHREFIDHVDLDTIDELTSKLEALKALITALDESKVQD